MSFFSSLFQSGDDPYKDPTSIGNLAISRGWATREDVGTALQKQEKRTPLGKILVEEGVLTDVQLEELLFEQKVKRERSRPKQNAMRLRRGVTKLRELTQDTQDQVAEMRKLAKGV